MKRKSKFIIVKLKTLILCTVLIFAATVFVGIKTMSFYSAKAAISAQDGVPVNILMYHGITRDSKHAGKYVITERELKNDLEYIKANGYETITVLDLIAYVYDDVPLPEKPIILTFDDGFCNNYLYAYPLLKENNMKAVLSVVGICSEDFSKCNDENPDYAYVTWNMIREMNKSGVFEIGNHTYNMHKIDNSRRGSERAKGEPAAAYKDKFSSDIMRLQKLLADNAGVVPLTFAYPYGFISEESGDMLREMGFLASLSCNEGINYISKDSKCLYALKRYVRPSGINSADFFARNGIN